MLFKKEILGQIKEGRVKTAFRKWTKPTVKAGGTLHTPAGVLRIRSITEVAYDEITDRAIKLAGYAGRAQLDKELAGKAKGIIYKITFRLESEDPRIALRQNTRLDADDIRMLTEKLDRMDATGTHAGWTGKVLTLVLAEPGRNAAYYAQKLGYDKDWFKLHIRKLKNLGLTVSLEKGYEISPRGKEFIKKTFPSKP